MARVTAIVATAALALGLAGGAWLTNKSRAADMQRYETRIAQIERDHATAVAEANAAALAETTRLQEIVKDAQQQHQDRLVQLQSDADAARRAADRLRADLATSRLQLSQLSEQAVRQYADTSSVVLAQCAERYQRVAEVADRCIADVGLMREAWPR